KHSGNLSRSRVSPLAAILAASSFRTKKKLSSPNSTKKN
ncbi:unnamed protein product, partial [Brassica oleracea]